MKDAEDAKKEASVEGDVPNKEVLALEEAALDAETS